MYGINLYRAKGLPEFTFVELVVYKNSKKVLQKFAKNNKLSIYNRRAY